ncbi:MAG: pyridoxal phosphate-dependent aminotransferase [Actinomycetota bacterium]|nr:pyridoxal phosphate-dependent aminotransferase [Actinomycetota bacterium]
MPEISYDFNKILSQRARNLEESPTFALEKKIDAFDSKLKKEGKFVIRFGIGQPDFNTPENIKEAAKIAIDENKTKYTASTGIRELKNAVIEKFRKENNLEYELENIFVGNGAKQVLDVIIRTFVNKGDKVLIPVPYWVSYTQQVILSEGEPVFVKYNNELKIDLNDLEKICNRYGKQVKLIILNSPNNPSGIVYNKGELEAIGEICAKNGIFIISDEVYEKFLYGEIKHYSIAALSEELKKITITVNAVSKTYSMTGWRIGYCAAAKEIISQMAKIQDQAASNPCTPAQWASIEALNGSQESVNVMRNEYEKRRNYIFERLSNIKNIKCNLPEGAFYVFPDISGFFNKKIKSSFDFAEQLLENDFVGVVPGAAFGDDRFIRISYATSINNIKEGIDRLENFCKKIS